MDYMNLNIWCLRKAVKLKYSFTYFQSCPLQCLSVQEILEQFQLDTSSPIHQNDFLQLCPVLISQLDVHACGAAQDGPDNSSHAHSESQHGHHDHDHDHDHEHDDSVTYTETAMNAVPLKGKELPMCPSNRKGDFIFLISLLTGT